MGVLRSLLTEIGVLKPKPVEQVQGNIVPPKRAAANVSASLHRKGAFKPKPPATSGGPST